MSTVHQFRDGDARFRAYLEWALSRDRVDLLTREVEGALAQGDRWQRRQEWRVMTEMEMSISRVFVDGKTLFRVEVRCGYEMSCLCPTVDRAVLMLRIYAQLVPDLYFVNGWP